MHQKSEEINESALSKNDIREKMEVAKIPGVSIAVLKNQIVTPIPLGETTDIESSQVNQTTPFGAASLSKPVFAYLILKLIELNKTKKAKPELGEFKYPFDLQTPLYTLFRDDAGAILPDNENPFFKKFGYDLKMMSSLPKDDITQAEDGKIYLSEKPKAYFIKGMEQAILLPQDIDLTNLETKLKDVNFKKDILAFTSKTGHTSSPSQLDQASESAKKINAELVLSHRTGLKIVDTIPFKFQFEPGAQYAYSGPGIECLQDAFDALTGTNIETLAQENIFSPMHLYHTSYGSERKATNSLITTAEDYMTFISNWANDDSLNYAFRPVHPEYSMHDDYMPQSDKCLVSEVNINEQEKTRVTWGLGVGLVQNDNGQIIAAYHTGDMNESRAGFGIELDSTGHAVAGGVYLSNSHNGHILAESVLPRTLAPALDYFCATYGFARNAEELDHTDFHGLNPAILKPEIQKMAYDTRTYSPSMNTLQTIADTGHIPAVSYAYVERQEESKIIKTSMAVGKTKSNDADMNTVHGNTQFPASSLSKIVFTYLVLQLVKNPEINFDLDKPLHETLQYERFLVDGQYPEKAQELTARHVLSHTTGLPNFGPDPSSILQFNADTKLGEGYSYSGESFLYLQKAIETKMGRDLEALAQEYVFGPLGMKRSTFLPPKTTDTDVVAVHTELGKPTSIFVCDPPLNAAASVLTTGEDFSKFLAAWLENMDDPIIKQAFEPTHPNSFETCGIGWHIYKNEDEVIAYQYGANPNTRSFVAINLTEKKGTAFFTNSENGMAITNQVFGSPTLAPIGNTQSLYNHLNKHIHYTPSDEPGWQETISGKIAEVDGKFEEARHYFEKALQLSPQNESIQKRLEWFNNVHYHSQAQEFTTSLQLFAGNYQNPYNDNIEMLVRDGCLIFKEFDQEQKFVRISENEFLPEKDQLFKIRFDGNQMNMSYVFGGPDKQLSKQLSPKLQSQETSSQEQMQKQHHFKGTVEHIRIEEQKKEQLIQGDKGNIEEQKSDQFEVVGNNNCTSPTPFSTKPKPTEES